MPDAGRPALARRVRVRGVPGRHPSPRREGPVNPQEQAEALARGRQRAQAYRGHKHTGLAAVAFTRDAVADCVDIAPQPVTDTWVLYSTSVVGQLASWCAAQGVDLTREAVFDRSRIDRFLSQHCAGMVPGARASYRARLDKIAQFLLNGANDAPWARPCLAATSVVTPYSFEETGRITAWARAVRPYRRRERLQAVVALGLGAGIRRGELSRLVGDAVRRDEHGVHVAVGPSAVQPARVVTVATDWEDAVWAHAQAAASNLMVARTRSALHPVNLEGTLHRANVHAPVPVVIGRLRNTWLARHLVAGTPLPILMEQAGITTLQHFEKILRTPDLASVAGAGISPSQAAGWMRSARR